ncbi:MAG: DUF1489 domain-containing protein [Ancalomicrobiaceae bacterium]|nr:DUF1489 domain-containing protein [Ancalomicrobiaceae bacterium]
MPLHLVKLCVGCDSIDDLASWIAERAAEKRRHGLPPYHIHRTRQMPKRGEEIVGGGSLYWVIRGEMRVRETIVELNAVTDDQGVPHCDIVLSGNLVPVEPMRMRPFQGWRYLDEAGAPRDLPRFGQGAAELPAEFIRELAVLGLL